MRAMLTASFPAAMTAMPNISIQRPHTMSMAKAKAAVDEVAEKIAGRFQVTTLWENDTLKFTRSGVQGAIAVSPSQVKVDAELGFMLGFLKGTIEKEVIGYLDKVLS
jgi:putative polyhydroxyalkanoate system protein